MENDVERLQWLISLSDRDLSGVAEWEWPTIKADLIRFLMPWADSKRVGVLLRIDGKKDLREEVITEVQAELRGVLKDLVSGSAMFSGSASTPVYQSEIPLNVTLQIIQHDMNKDEKAQFYCRYDGPLRDRIFVALSNILAAGSVAPSQFRRCPECERIFLLGRMPDPKKKYFCSPKCSSKHTSRTYYERLKKGGGEAFKAKRRETSHQSHVKKQQKKYGSIVKVARRPRKTTRG